MREKNIRTKEKHQFLEVGKDTKLARAEEYGFLTDAYLETERARGFGTNVMKHWC